MDLSNIHPEIWSQFGILILFGLFVLKILGEFRTYLEMRNAKQEKALGQVAEQLAEVAHAVERLRGKIP